jgi:hypothetical protein
MGKRAEIGLPHEEWAFSLLEEAENETARNYELSRAAVYLERIRKQQLEVARFDEDAWLEDRVVAIRRRWQLTGFTRTVRENPIWFSHPVCRVLVLNPEWPNVPYLKIDPSERLRRIRELSIPPTEADRLSQLESLLNPLNPTTGEKQIIKIAVPKNLTHEELLKAFAAYLKLNFPDQGKSKKQHGKSPYAKQQGRGSEQASVVDDLNALAAYRLCKIARLPRAQVISLIKYPKGHRHSGDLVYGEEKKLDKPLRRILDRIQKFRDETMGNLTPLEPLGLSQPDFDSL